MLMKTESHGNFIDFFIRHVICSADLLKAKWVLSGNSTINPLETGTCGNTCDNTCDNIHAAMLPTTVSNEDIFFKIFL